jgi:hypothetical protein
MRKTYLSLVATAGVIAMTAPAHATVTIEKSPSYVQPEENVQLDTDLIVGDNMLQGTTNQTGSTVVFTSSTDDLLAPPQGQARIEAVDGSLGALVFSLADLDTFTTAEFNILASVGGPVTLSAYDASNMLLASLNSTLGSAGQNFFGFQADPSTPITSIGIVAGPNTAISSIGQFRVGGISTTAEPVPEPGTWALLLVGFGALGFAMRRRKTKHSLRVRYA